LVAAATIAEVVFGSFWQKKEQEKSPPPQRGQLNCIGSTAEEKENC